jgi:hypothetical protein
MYSLHVVSMWCHVTAYLHVRRYTALCRSPHLCVIHGVLITLCLYVRSCYSVSSCFVGTLHYAGHITCVSIYDVPITLRLYVMSCYSVSLCFVATLHSTCHITWFPFMMYSLHFVLCDVMSYCIFIFVGTLNFAGHITCVSIYDVLITRRLYVMSCYSVSSLS